MEEQRFCELTVMEGLGKSEAYRTAYKPSNVLPKIINSRAYELAKRDKILDYIAFLHGEIQSEARLMASDIQEKVRISGGDVLQELAYIVTSDIRDYLDWDGDGPNIHSSTSLTTAQAKALQSIKFKTVEKISLTGQITRTTDMEFKLWNKLEASRQLIDLYNLAPKDPDEEGKAKAPPPIPMNLHIEVNVLSDALIAAQRSGMEVLGLASGAEDPETNGAGHGHS